MHRSCHPKKRYTESFCFFFFFFFSSKDKRLDIWWLENRGLHTRKSQRKQNGRKQTWKCWLAARCALTHIEREGDIKAQHDDFPFTQPQKFEKFSFLHIFIDNTQKMVNSSLWKRHVIKYSETYNFGMLARFFISAHKLFRMFRKTTENLLCIVECNFVQCQQTRSEESEKKTCVAECGKSGPYIWKIAQAKKLSHQKQFHFEMCGLNGLSALCARLPFSLMIPNST